MRFADADAMARSEGTSIPPLDVRLDLQPGDRVGLYEEVRHPSMGAGYAPLEVLVLGSPEPGWFVGEDEDGREISFHAGNVADVLHGSPSMGGIFDWVKKILPPSPGELMKPPPAPVPLLPGPSAPPRPEERRGLIAQVKSLFMSPLTARPEAETPKKSVFDVFRKQEAPAGGLPAERAPGTVAPVEERPSVISVFKPGEKRIIPIVEQATAPAVFLAPSEKTIIPIIESMTAPATVLPKSAELEPYMVREQKQKELWSKVISEAAPEAPPIEKVVEIFTPEEVQPQAEVIPPNLPAKLHRTLKVLPMPRRSELLPSVEDVARGLATFFHPIEELWDTIRRNRQTPEWQESLAKTGEAKDEFETLGTCGGQPTIYEEFSSFFHIPWEEMRRRAVVRELDDYEQWVKTDLIWMDIISPLADRLTEAFNLMKPADLPGQIILERADPHGGHDDPCVMTIAYVEEGEPRGEVEPGLVYGSPVPQEEEDEGEEESPQKRFTREEAEEAVEKLEKEAVFFFQEREKLQPNDPEYRQKLAYLENELKNRQDELQSLSMALQAIEEPQGEFTVEHAQEEIARVEEDLVIINQERDQVRPNDPQYLQKVAALDSEIKKRETYLQTLSLALSAMQPKAKRAPAKKKPSKRGKKKGK